MLTELCEIISITEILSIRHVHEGYFKSLECIVLSPVDDELNFLYGN